MNATIQFKLNEVIHANKLIAINQSIKQTEKTDS